MVDRTDVVSTWLESRGRATDVRQGLAGELVSICIQCLVLLLKNAPTNDTFSGPLSTRLRVQAQRFSLWSDSFDASEGGLDAIIAVSERLDNTILTLLDKFGNALIELGAHHVIREHQKQSQEPRFNEFRQRFKILREYIHKVTHKTDEEDSDSESTTDSENSVERSDSLESTSPNSAIDDITLYNDLLMDLVPALRSPAKDEVLESRTVKTLKNIELKDERFRPFVSRILEKYPLIDTNLAIRLGEVNWRRKQRLTEKMNVRTTGVLKVKGETNRRSQIPSLSNPP